MRKTLSPLFSLLVFVFFLLAAFSASAFAAGAVEPADGSLLDRLTPVLDAFRGGHYAYAGALALVVAIALAKRYGGTWPNSDIGGSVLALAGSFFASVGVAIAPGTGATLGLGTLWTAGGVAVVAAGGYTLVKKLIMDPLLKSTWYTTKAPAWFKAAFGVVSWIFESPSPIAVATAAGDAAVKAAPAQGEQVATGKPTELK